MKYLIVILSGLFVFASCKDGKPEAEQKPNKQVTTYTLTKLAKDNTHKMDSNHLKGIVSSGDGEFVYVVSDQAEGLKVLEVEKGLWNDGLDKWNEVPNAAVRARLDDLTTKKVEGFAPYDKGLVFTTSGDGGLVVLKGFGVKNASHYVQRVNNFKAGFFNPLVVTKKDNSQFIYLFPAGIVAKRVLFRTYQEPPKVDNYAAPAWDNSLMKAGGTKLDTQILARTQDKEGNLLLADKDGIKRVLEADVGVANKFLDDSGKAIYKPDDFRLDGTTKNDHINTMQLIDDKLLVVGLKSTSDNNGGYAVLDMSEKTATWQHYGKGMGLSVDTISPERFKQRERTKLAAIITTQKGLIFMDSEGKMMEVTEGKGHLITAKMIGDVRAETADYEKAVDGSGGFLNDRPSVVKDGYLSAAQDKNGMWYLGFKGNAADDGGIFKLEIKIEQVQPPTAPPVMP